MKKVFFISFFLLFFSNRFLAQQKNLPLNRAWALSMQGDLNKRNDPNIHTTVKPLIEIDKYNYSNYDSSNSFIIDSTRTSSLFQKKLKKEHLIIINDSSSQFHLTIDPLFNFEYGKDLKDTSNEKLYKNTRGALVRGDIGKKFSFESSFYENQATFAQYIDNFNDTFKVVPGQGRWKNFKTNGYDYAMASGYISYSPITQFNFQLGHGKHIVGDGYRSLLLSDNSFNYPYARITSTFGKIQYTNIYAILMNLTSGGVTTPPYTERLFQKKAASFQMLSWNVHKRIQLGLFQGMIWQAADNQNKQHLNFNYFNPVIFVNPFVYSLNHTNNILFGTTLNFNLNKTFSIYTHWMIDDFIADSLGRYLNNKEGYQIGIKMFNLFKVNNLHVQVEYNQVFPYTYANKQTEQSYSHYNQPLAHPLGANFKESVSFINYRTGDFFAELKFNYALIGADSSGSNFGSNIFKPDHTAYYGLNSIDNEILQGVERTVAFTDLKIGYLINPSTNLNIVIGISNRVEKMNSLKSNTQFIYIGIRTSLTNIYYDF